jgi:hypothetical protein
MRLGRCCRLFRCGESFIERHRAITSSCYLRWSNEIVAGLEQTRGLFNDLYRIRK